ncbi:hypothetical protein Ahy_B01g055129 isoform B [Arachis hypogaea]|uniref:Uncharacterized protein n=1 Tax=Arachis hypogaea TaxID=3818 RepID=A0A445AV61_ARAHY|nr:hypothetical protein Ahy_B01g055129 isoform B [Arachis hypogaea]
MGNTGVSQSCGVSGIELESCEFSIRGGKLLAYSGNWYQVREIGLSPIHCLRRLHGEKIFPRKTPAFSNP